MCHDVEILEMRTCGSSCRKIVGIRVEELGKRFSGACVRDPRGIFKQGASRKDKVSSRLNLKKGDHGFGSSCKDCMPAPSHTKTSMLDM
jgi:hypothetical protein